MHLAVSRRSVALGILLYVMLPIAYVCQNTRFYTENPDLFGATLAPTYLCLALTIAGVITALNHYFTRKQSKPFYKWFVVEMSLLAMIAFFFLSQFNSQVRVKDRSQSGMLAELLALIQETLPNESHVLVLQSDHLFFPALYLQLVDKQFPNTVLFNPGWANSSWYWQYLRAKHPTLKFPVGRFSRAQRIEKFYSMNNELPLYFEMFEAASNHTASICLDGILLRKEARLRALQDKDERYDGNSDQLEQRNPIETPKVLLHT